MNKQTRNQTMRSGNDSGAVYFMTNEVEGKNQIVMLKRAMDGSLSQAGMFATAGSGAGKGPEAPFADPLGSQDSLVVNKEHTLLFVVNAGSNDISVFQIGPQSAQQS
jgi:6-phosphogluconolactonase